MPKITSRNSLLIPAGLLAIAAVGVVCLAQPARAETQTYSLSGFNEVAAGSGVDVVLKQGPFSVVANGNRKDIDRLDIRLEGSKLIVSHKPTITFFGHAEKNVVTVTAPTYVAITASGGADVDADGLNLNDVHVGASGGADLRLLGLTAKALDAQLSGGADIKLSGSCTALTAHASGGADFAGGEMKCQTADVHGSGGADLVAWASTSAKGHASAGSDILIRGNPTSLDKETSGGGSVKTS